jgi:hypothetical protein
MPEPGAAGVRLEAYLSRLRSKLRRLPDAQAAEIVEEIRSHVHESAAEGGALAEPTVAAALERLGTAEQLAAMYLTQDVLSRGERAPWRLLESLFRWATLSLAGCGALLACLAGYALAASFAFCALAKPFAPASVGLFQLDDSDTYSLHLGLKGCPPAGHELLGWWIVPVGLLVGLGGFWLTTRFALWSLRRMRRPAVELS